MRMKKVVACILALLMVSVVAVPVLAATYSAPITVTESDGVDYVSLPIIATIDNAELAGTNIITASGLDTRVLSSSTVLPHMLTTDRTLFALPVSANSQYPLSYTAGDDLLSNFSIITGYAGYITIADDAEMRLTTEFEIELKGHINTDAVTPAAFQIAGVTSNAASGNVTPALPVGWAADDIWLCLIASLDNVNSTMPAGWTAVDAGTNNGAGLRTTLYWRRAVIGDTAPLITHAAGSGISAVIVGYRGIKLYGSPFDVNQSVYVKTPASVVNNFGAGMTTTINNDIIVLLSGVSGQTTSTTYTGTPTPTERVDKPNIAARPELVIAEFTQTAAIAAGARTSTITSFLNNGYQLSLIPQSKNLISKTNSFRTYVSDDEEITAAILNVYGAPTTITLDPTGVGTTTGWHIVGGLATNWQTAADDDDATYNEENVTEDDRDTYAMEDVSLPAGYIVSDVTVYARMQRYSATYRFGGAVFKSGAYYYDGNYEIAADWTEYSQSFALNPDGAVAWTEATINAIEAGVKTGGNAANCGGKVAKVWVEVTYTFPADYEVTATGIASAEPKIVVSLSANLFSISVDDAVSPSPKYDETAFTGSVSGNDNPWILMDNSTTQFMSYMNYYKHTTGIAPVGLKVTYEPITIIASVGTTGTLPDLIDNGGFEDATITWGANPSGISLLIGSLLPVDPSIAPETVEGGASSIVPETGDSDMLTTGIEGENLPFYGLIHGLLTDYENLGGPHIPMAYFWKLVVMILGWGFGTAVMIATRQVIFGLIGYILGFSIPAYAMGGILDPWIPIVYGIGALCLAGLLWKWTSSSIG